MRLALFVFLLGLLPLSAANMVVNGDFTTNCSSWTTSNTDTSFCQNGSGLGPGNPGGWASLNSGPSVAPSMSQTIAGLALGQSYTLEWDMQSAFKCCGNQSTFGVRVAIDNEQYTFTIPQSMTWTSFSRTFVYDGNSSVLSFTSQLNGTDQDAGFDNISIEPVETAVPEPSSALLLAGGIAALAARRLRRG